MSIRKLTGAVFVFSSLFPWVSFGTNGFDSQPWALGLALIFLAASLSSPIRLQFLVLVLLIPAVVTVGWAHAERVDFAFLRAVFGYASVPWLLIAYYTYVRAYGFPFTALRVANLIYLVVAALQQVLGAEISSGLATVRTSLDRGMPSLAVEPTYFGVLLIFFGWILCICTNYTPRGRNLTLLITNLLFIVFIAKSSMAILFLGLAAGFVVCYKVRPSLYMLITVSALFLVATYGVLLEQTRVGALVNTLQLRGLSHLIVADASINVRLAHVVIPWYAAVTSLFVPHGFSAFSDAFDRASRWHGGLFWYGAGTNVIMSYVGAFIFELGLIGALFLGYVFALLLEDSRRRLFELAFLFLLLNAAIPVAFPLVPLIVVLLYFSGDQPDRPTLWQETNGRVNAGYVLTRP